MANPTVSEPVWDARDKMSRRPTPNSFKRTRCCVRSWPKPRLGQPGLPEKEQLIADILAVAAERLQLLESTTRVPSHPPRNN